ncbi:vitamin K-dependent protein C-like [Bradysia coprophila]|uniref:vitamin K-dependent protein C-like n=1 Tax=Bradysia coprophila TaxID=38358 RepID=UPI00187D8BE8|nr:vitamin K-dependent protein C-like [Bradysia coprophila]
MKLIFCVLLIAIFGLRSSAGILNGEVAEQRPYFAYIQGGSGPTGGGAFITRRHVLTIARLISGFTQWQIGYGATVVSNLTRVTSTIAFIHPGYVSPNTNNIGVIILPQIINSPLVEPVSLPLPSSVMVLPRLDEEGTIVGFNVRTTSEVPIVSADLRAAYLLVQPNSACANMQDTAENLFCARDNEYSANVCTHSVGSPFVTSFRGNLILTGLLTQFELFCIRSDRSRYVQTQNYLEWIRSVANIN